MWVLAVAAVIAGSLLPPGDLPAEPVANDKLMHFLAYFMLMAGAVQLYARKRSWVAMAVMLAGTPHADEARTQRFQFLLRAATSGRMSDAVYEQACKDAATLPTGDMSYFAQMQRGNSLSHPILNFWSGRRC